MRTKAFNILSVFKHVFSTLEVMKDGSSVLQVLTSVE